MKAWILILICIVLGYVLYRIVWTNDSAIVMTESYDYFDCKVKYKHAYIFTQFRRDYENYFQEDSAKYALMRCLCEKYTNNKDSNIKNFIIDFYDNDSPSRERYLSEILYNKLDTNILLEYCERIYSNDKRILKYIEMFKNKDDVFLKSILIRWFGKDCCTQYEYYKILYELAVPVPCIDTIIKYRAVIFRSPRRYYHS